MSQVFSTLSHFSSAKSYATFFYGYDCFSSVVSSVADDSCRTFQYWRHQVPTGLPRSQLFSLDPLFPLRKKRYKNEKNIFPCNVFFCKCIQKRIKRPEFLFGLLPIAIQVQLLKSFYYGTFWLFLIIAICVLTPTGKKQDFDEVTCLGTKCIFLKFGSNEVKSILHFIIARSAHWAWFFNIKLSNDNLMDTKLQ